MLSRRLFLALFLFALAPIAAQQNVPFPGAIEVEQSLAKLNNLGTVLMIAAHPDDEQTAVLAYFARGRHMRTAYLSLTRGEGGQNLIGSGARPRAGESFARRNCWRRAKSTARSSSSRAPSTSDSPRPPPKRWKNGATTASSPTWSGWSAATGPTSSFWTSAARRPTATDSIRCRRFSGRKPSTGGGRRQPVPGAIEIRPAVARQAPGARQFQLQRLPRRIAARHAASRTFPELPSRGRGRHRRVQPRAGIFLPGTGHHEPQHASQPGHGRGSPPRRGRDDFGLVAGSPVSKDLFEGIDTTWNRLPGGARWAR
jgi:hypothetical protein